MGLFLPATTPEGRAVNAKFKERDDRIELIERQVDLHMPCFEDRVEDFYDDFKDFMNGNFHPYENYEEALEDNDDHMEYVVDSFYQLIIMNERQIMKNLWLNLRLQWSVIELSKRFDGHIVEKIVFWSEFGNGESCTIRDQMYELIPHSLAWPYTKGNESDDI